jgi:hypothetical protein
MGEIKLNSRQDWKEYKRVTRSLNEDDFELMQESDSSSSGSEEDKEMKEFQEDAIEMT